MPTTRNGKLWRSHFITRTGSEYIEKRINEDLRPKEKRMNGEKIKLLEYNKIESVNRLDDYQQLKI